MFPDLKNEVEIVWHEDPFNYFYLRETWVMNPSRSRPIPKLAFGPGKRVIGYAVLNKQAPPSSISLRGRTFWHRRVWWLYDDDAAMPRDKGVYGPSTCSYPIESVSPHTVKAREASVFINSRPSLFELEKIDTRLRRVLEWLTRKGGSASIRDIQCAKIPGLNNSHEISSVVNKLAELSWCWVRKEERGRTKQKSTVVKVIFFGEEGSLEY